MNEFPLYPARVSDTKDLDEKIALARETLKTTQANTSNRARALSNLGRYLHHRHHRDNNPLEDMPGPVAKESIDSFRSLSQESTVTGGLNDLDEAIQVMQEAIQATSEKSQDRAIMANNLALYYHTRCKATQSVDDNDQSIQAIQTAVELSQFAPQRAHYLISRGQYLFERCTLTTPENRTVDLEEAIRVTQIGLASTLDIAQRATALHWLGIYLYERYQFGARNPGDLEEAIRITQVAVESSIRTEANRGNFLYQLGRFLTEKYSISDCRADLEDAIRASKEAVELSKSGSGIRIGRLASLANQLNSKYLMTQMVSDLDEAIQTTSMALNELQAGSSRRLELLLRLDTQVRRKFDQTDASEDLQSMIGVARQVLAATPVDHVDRTHRLFALAVDLRKFYKRTEAREALEEAIDLVQEAVRTVKDDTSIQLHSKHLQAFLFELSSEAQTGPNSTETIVNLTQSIIEASATNVEERNKTLISFLEHLDELCESTGDMEDIERAINATQTAVDVTPIGHPSRIILYKHLANYIAEKSEYTDDVADMTKAIVLWKEALVIAPKDHRYIEEIRQSTRAYMDRRYAATGGAADLEEAIQFLRVDLVTGAKDTAIMFKILFVLGTYLWDKYRMGLVLADMEEAIKSTSKALELSTKDFQKRKSLKNLASLYGLKYQRTNDVVDLEDAITFARRAADEPWDKLNRAGCLNTLSIALRARYERTDSIPDLEHAIALTREAAANTLRGPQKPTYLGSLARHLCARYERIGKIADLEEAIRIARTAVEIGPMNHPEQKHPEQANFFATLAYCLHLRYLAIEILSDLEEAIQAIRTAVDIAPRDASVKATFLNSLSVYLSERYRRSEAISDLKEAIESAQAAVGAASEDHPDRGLVLRTLGKRLADHYVKTNEVEDLNKAVEVTREALKSSSEEHDTSLTMDSLGQHLAERFKVKRQMVDLDEAISLTQNAAVQTPHGLQRATFLRTLALHYTDRWTELQKMTDLEAAIQAAGDAVENTPMDHPDRAQMWRDLGSILENHDMQRAKSCYKSALKHPNARVVVRIEAGTEVLRCCVQSAEWEEAFEALEIAVGLAPLLTSRSLQNSDKQHLLAQVVGLASDAAAMAFNAHKAADVALRLLEQGRGLLAASLEEIRADVAALRKEHPDLAEEFYHLQGELTLQSTRERAALRGDQHSTFHVRTSQPYQADRAFEQLLIDIRKTLAFKGFLLPPTTSELQAAATGGHIVVINISEYRCDAILIERDQIRSLPLPDLNSADIEERSLRDDLGSPEALAWLWNAVANPVLAALGYDRCITTEHWPRIWWIPTGSLTRFPLHAAGYHGDRSGETVLDRVMSSYGSSVKAIINGRQRSALATDPTEVAKALLVSMKYTPSHSSLHFADMEVEMVQNICKAIPFEIVKPGQLKEDIVAHLPLCSIFHFAGHGHVDMADPSQSYLAVYDGTITVEALLEMNLRERSPFLAYLSACGTGQIKDDRFLDESIHLISACQLAGFRHVVGTLWEVNDELCVEMARIMYDTVRQRGLTDDSVCLGVHRASRQLRENWLLAGARSQGFYDKSLLAADHSGRPATMTSRNTSSLDSKFPRNAVLSLEHWEKPEELQPLWVPYVHYGV